jgi:hypothetical protein
MSRHMGGVLLGLVMVLATVACQPFALTAKGKAATVESIALRPGDVSGLQRCSGSGDVESVLQDEKVHNPMAYSRNATEWEQWKSQGASEAYFAVYGRTATDCDALSVSAQELPRAG